MFENVVERIQESGLFVGLLVLSSVSPIFLHARVSLLMLLLMRVLLVPAVFACCGDGVVSIQTNFTEARVPEASGRNLPQWFCQEMCPTTHAEKDSLGANPIFFGGWEGQAWVRRFSELYF